MFERMSAMTQTTPRPPQGLTMLAAALLLAGCSMIPTYERPAAPVPTTFPQAPAATGAGVAAADLAGKDYFSDPRLQQLITSALANNRDLLQSVP